MLDKTEEFGGWKKKRKVKLSWNSDIKKICNVEVSIFDLMFHFSYPDFSITCPWNKKKTKMLQFL